MMKSLYVNLVGKVTKGNIRKSSDEKNKQCKRKERCGTATQTVAKYNYNIQLMAGTGMSNTGSADGNSSQHVW